MLSGVKFVKKSTGSLSKPTDNQNKTKETENDVNNRRISDGKCRTNSSRSLEQTIQHVPKTSPTVSNYDAAEMLRRRVKKAPIKEVDASTEYSNKSIMNDDQSKDFMEIATLKRKLELERKELMTSDPSNLDIATLVSMEKLNSNQMDGAFYKNILSYQKTASKTSQSKSGGDEEDDDDINTNDNRTQKKKLKVDETAQYEREIKQLLRKQESHTQARSKCSRCNYYTLTHESQQVAQYIISQASHTCIRVKEEHLSITTGHFELIPRHHECSILKYDEETNREIDRYKSCINRMYMESNQFLLAMEVCLNPKSSYHHTYLDLVPVDINMMDDVIMYFRQAFMELQQEGRLIELTAKRGLSRAVPTGFPYIYVEWGERLTGDSSSSSSSSSSSTTRSTKDSSSSVIIGGGKNKNKLISSDCIGYVFVYDREHDSGEDKSTATGGHDTRYDFCLDVLAGLYEQDLYRFRRKMRPTISEINMYKQEVVVSWKSKWNDYDWIPYYNLSDNTT